MAFKAYIWFSLGRAKRLTNQKKKYIYNILGDSGDFQTSRYQGIVKAEASGVFEDLKFKISEGSDQN